MKFRQILGLWVFSVTEYPPKLKFRQILGLWVFSVTEYPPPNWNLGRSWDFEYFQLQNTPPEKWNLGRSWDWEYFLLQNTPPPENWNWGRSWDFEYFQLQNTPPHTTPPTPKIEIEADLGTLSIFSYRIPPPPKKNWNLGRSWDFEYSQLQNPPPPPPDLPNGKLCVVSYHMWRLYPTRITTRYSNSCRNILIWL